MEVTSLLREAGLAAGLLVAACNAAVQQPAAGPSPQDGSRAEWVLAGEVGRPLAGWTVEAAFVAAASGGRPEHGLLRAETGADGSFPCFGVAEIGGVTAWPPGDDGSIRRRVAPERVRLSTRGVRLTLHGMWVDDWPGRREGTPTSTPDPPPAKPRARYAIDGVVLDRADRPIALAWVRFRHAGSGVAVQTLCDLDGRFTEIHTHDADYDVTVLVPHPTKSSEPGVPAGTVHGGARDVVLRVER
jgi:hypothetical protein